MEGSSFEISEDITKDLQLECNKPQCQPVANTLAPKCHSIEFTAICAIPSFVISWMRIVELALLLRLDRSNAPGFMRSKHFSWNRDIRRLLRPRPLRRRGGEHGETY